MIRRIRGHDRSPKARGWRAADQARRIAPAVALVALGACTERIGELDPRPGLTNLLFARHLEGREPPPGLDRPWPHLSSVPAAPTPPDQASRERLSANLAADRERSRTPLAIMGGGGIPAAAGAVPPSPPRLAAAPVIPDDPVPMGRPAPAVLPAPAPAAPQPPPQPAPQAAPQPAPSLAQPATPQPAAAPAAPPPPGRDLLAPPPPPSPDLLAPPRRD